MSADACAINPITCEAHGLCAELLPELIRLDDWGYPIIDESEVPPELIGLARRAVDACPTLALLHRRGLRRSGCAGSWVRRSPPSASCHQPTSYHAPCFQPIRR